MEMKIFAHATTIKLGCEDFTMMVSIIQPNGRIMSLSLDQFKKLTSDAFAELVDISIANVNYDDVPDTMLEKCKLIDVQRFVRYSYKRVFLRIDNFIVLAVISGQPPRIIIFYTNDISDLSEHTIQFTLVEWVSFVKMRNHVINCFEQPELLQMYEAIPKTHSTDVECFPEGKIFND